MGTVSEPDIHQWMYHTIRIPGPIGAQRYTLSSSPAWELFLNLTFISECITQFGSQVQSELSATLFPLVRHENCLCTWHSSVNVSQFGSQVQSELSATLCPLVRHGNCFRKMLPEQLKSGEGERKVWWSLHSKWLVKVGGELISLAQGTWGAASGSIKNPLQNLVCVCVGGEGGGRCVYNHHVSINMSLLAMYILNIEICWCVFTTKLFFFFLLILV